MARVYQDTVGAVLTVTGLGDISGASVYKLLVTKPDGTVVSWPAAGNGTLAESDTAISHTTIADDLDQAGSYKIHPYVEVSGWTGEGEMVTWEIFPRYSR